MERRSGVVGKIYVSTIARNYCRVINLIVSLCQGSRQLVHFIHAPPKIADREFHFGPGPTPGIEYRARTLSPGNLKVPNTNGPQSPVVLFFYSYILAMLPILDVSFHFALQLESPRFVGFFISLHTLRDHQTMNGDSHNPPL